MSVPSDEFVVPEDVLAAVDRPSATAPIGASAVSGRSQAHTITPVWLNSVGGSTYRIGTPHGSTLFLKRNPLGGSEDLGLEATKLRWLSDRHPAPTVIDHWTGAEAEFLLTAGLPGTSAVTGDHLGDPDRTIAQIGLGLRRLHSLPVVDCPWAWTLMDRGTEAGVDLVAKFGPAPGEPDPVVCHGDPCAPNTLLGADEVFVGHVDVQRLGVGDRWADLAVVTMSFAWNYANYDESVFWTAYGIEPDVEKIDYWRAVWNAE